MSLVAFLNSLLSYLLLFAVCVLVVAAGIFIGIRLRKKKDAKDAVSDTQEEEKEA